MEKYINDAIIGNKKLTASFSKKGELLRIFYPNCDYKQFIHELFIGVKVNDSAIIYLHNDINNVYIQSYIENTNILQTEILNTYFNLRILQTDFVTIKENILVKDYVLKNESNINLNVDFLAYSNVLTNMNNDTCGFIKNDSLIQYNHDYSMCIFSKEKLLSYQVNGAKETISSGIIGGKDYIGLSPNSAISYDLKEIKPGEEAHITLYIMINDNEKNNVFSELESEIERIRKIDVKDIFNECQKYWEKFVKEHDKLNVEKSEINDKIKNIYRRSILLFNLLQNKDTGGISAGIEVDEGKTKCGRYSYCWPRDAVFITKALDIVGMQNETTKFYSIFCKKTQSKDGKWEQRFYTDCRLAPSWGYQIDETASVIIGLYDHYLKIKDKEFLKSNFKMCEKAVEFLEKYVNDILENKNKIQKSYDLWEEYEGISLYSISAIFSAINDMLKIDKILKPLFENNRLKIEVINKRSIRLEKLVRDIKEYAVKTFYDEERKTYVRNIDDKKMDISIIGSIVPFELFLPKEKNILNTIEKIDMTLRTYTGGYIRYEGDGYIGGYNPWPIATLWMALYCLEVGEYKKSVQCFEFVVNSATKHGFLGEQVDNEKMQAKWIIGLAWSHAMFIIVLEKLHKLKLL